MRIDTLRQRIIRLIVVSAALMVLIPHANAPGQTQGGQTRGENSEEPQLDYTPYTKDEFPGWARDLRRFETILIGSLPFTFFFSNIGFDSYAYVSRGYDENYLPLFFGSSPEKEVFRADTKLQRLSVSLALSGTVALIDYLIGKARAD